MEMQHLQPNVTLQNGKYRIVSTLGQGGFGITYLAIQSGLERRVAVKEFFMKEYCERDKTSNRVTPGTEGGREQVTRFREKFLKEARTIAQMNHPNIVRIIDVFEENNTAYYVMEYAKNGSLADKVNRDGCLSEPVATRYILQLAEALSYIHHRKMNHLDVKPANILLDEKDNVVLIDFGISKQYDAVTGDQTSSTPVGISEGYAPMEQSKKGGVAVFTPETDIYSLGATFFTLLTGVKPPSASDVMEDGLPVEKLRSKGVSSKTIAVISKAMESRKKDRMKSVEEFVEGLKDGRIKEPEKPKDVEKPKPINNDETRLKEGVVKPKPPKSPVPKPNPNPKPKRTWLWVVIGVIVVVGTVLAVVLSPDTPNVRTYTVNGVSFDMVKVQGGTFNMGATREQGSDADSDEKPAHSVTLSSYYIGQTEVTQALWKAVMGSNPSHFKGDNLPVEEVSWDDCQEFVRKLNQLTGKNFRLPTEAEWEYAARGGGKSRGYKYSGSNTLGDVAWYEDNSGSTTHPVATKQANELGLYDMSGNVDEWCQDGCRDYTTIPQNNPKGPISTPNCAPNCATRGGSWEQDAWGCRVSVRESDDISWNWKDLGFRLALSE